MITTEDFWCPTHGRLPQAAGNVIANNPKGDLCIPYYAVRCRQCGLDGSFVCQGDTVACDVQGTMCVYHQCDTGPDPYPPGRDYAWYSKEARKIREQQRADDNAMGLWDAGGDMDVKPDGGGIFGGARRT